MLFRRLAVIAAVFALPGLFVAMCQGPVKAQGTIQDGAVVQGHLTVAPTPSGGPPTTTACTLAVGSTDMAGQCAATATSGVAITFNKPFAQVPFCIVTDSVTATGINIGTLNTTTFILGTTAVADVIRWICLGRAGGG